MIRRPRRCALRHDPVDAPIVLDLVSSVLGVDGADADHLAPVGVELDDEMSFVHLWAAVVAESGSARSLKSSSRKRGRRRWASSPPCSGRRCGMTSLMPSGDARGVRSTARHRRAESDGRDDGGWRLEPGSAFTIADTYATLRPALAGLAPRRRQFRSGARDGCPASAVGEECAGDQRRVADRSRSLGRRLRHLLTESWSFSEGWSLRASPSSGSLRSRVRRNCSARLEAGLTTRGRLSVAVHVVQTAGSRPSRSG